MSSSFQFKRFEIEHSQAAMKVGFDGVLLGAWADVAGCQRILDIGTGTGLIALMLAQRSEDIEPPVVIDAVEIDAAAYREAVQNAKRSPWSNRVVCHHRSAQEFCASVAAADYDLIVCNPPFFEGDSASAEPARATARHAKQLEVCELFSLASVLSVARLCVVMPVDRQSECLAAAIDNGLALRRCARVRPNPRKSAKRVLLEFQRGACDTGFDEFAIETSVRHEYTAEFKALTSAFYLKM